MQICTVCAFISVIELPRIPAYYPKRVIQRRFCDLKSGHVAASALSFSLRFLWFPAEHRPGMQAHGFHFWPRLTAYGDFPADRPALRCLRSDKRRWAAFKTHPAGPCPIQSDVSVLFKKYDTQCDSDRNAGIYEGVYKIRLTDEVFSFISLRQARPVPHTIECTLCEHSIVMH